MDNIAVISIFIGAIFIILRGPLIFAPEATIAFYERLLESTLRIRIMGAVMTAFGSAMIFVARGSEQLEALIILCLGWIMFFAAVIFLLILPSWYKSVAELFLDVLNDTILRVIGVLSVIFGVLFILMGIELLTM